jgi:segregation and condensation protein A
MGYDIKLENFEGPLDLLLHLIKKNEMDIYDIQIAEVTGQYLSILDTMQNLNLDIAGEFLLMAATLLHIKSRMLLPPSVAEEAEEEELDPRAELVRRLLEYQKYKDAGENINRLPQVNRDIFIRSFPSPDRGEPDEAELVAVGLFELVEAFQRLLKETSDPYVHEVQAERLSVSERITAIMDQLSGRRELAFMEIFTDAPERPLVVVTFLALLELVRLRMVRLMQNSRCGGIWLYPAVDEESAAALTMNEENLGYL